MLVALGAGVAPYLTNAVFEGLQQRSGELVRTPKKGSKEGRHRARAALPTAEIALALLSTFSVVASVQTGHHLATPFASRFAIGYGCVAMLVVTEQARRRREAPTPSEQAEPAASATEAPLAVDLG